MDPLFISTVLAPAEFVAVMSRKVNASYTADQVKSAFKVGPTTPACLAMGESIPKFGRNMSLNLRSIMQA